jgi:hypothetical protein
MSARQPIVVCMVADPEPHEGSVDRFDREQAGVGSDPSGSKVTNLLEPKRRVSRILLATRVRLIGELLDI